MATRKTGEPRISEFDAWTDADDEQAFKQAADVFTVKHVIKNGEYWGLVTGGQIFKLPLALSIDDFERLSKTDTDVQTIDALKTLMRNTFGDDQAKRIEKIPVQSVMNLIQDYSEVITKTQGVGLGKSSASTTPSTAPTVAQ